MGEKSQGNEVKERALETLRGNYSLWCTSLRCVWQISRSSERDQRIPTKFHRSEICINGKVNGKVNGEGVD